MDATKPGKRTESKTHREKCSICLKRGLRVVSVSIGLSGSRGTSGEAHASGFDTTASSLDAEDEVYSQFGLRSHGETSRAAALAVLRDVEVVSQ